MHAGGPDLRLYDGCNLKTYLYMRGSDVVFVVCPPGLEVIKLEYSLRLKIKRKQPIIALYFESENELKFYNLEARVKLLNFFYSCIQLLYC